MLVARVEVNKFLFPSQTTSTPTAPSALAVLLDTSASRLLGFGRQLAGVWGALRVFEGLLPKNAKLLLVAFDQEIEIMHDGAEPSSLSRLALQPTPTATAPWNHSMLKSRSQTYLPAYLPPSLPTYLPYHCHRQAERRDRPRSAHPRGVVVTGGFRLLQPRPSARLTAHPGGQRHQVRPFLHDTCCSCACVCVPSC